MQQIAIPYTLVGPDGTTVILDGTGSLDASSAPWRLEAVQGLDSANVRASTEELPEEDGAEFNPGFLGSRPIVLEGATKADLSFADRNAAMVTLSRASMALRGDALLRFQPDGMPALELRVRREQPLRYAGRGPRKTFLLPLVAADPRIYSQAVNTQTGTAIVQLGAAFDWVFDVNFGGGTGAIRELAVSNAGNFPTPPVVRIEGPISNPVIANSQTGEQLSLTANGGLSLAAGQWVDVDMLARTVTRNDGTNEYDKVAFPGSTWWYLNAGSTIITLNGAGSTGSTKLTATWRDAWA